MLRMSSSCSLSILSASKRKEEKKKKSIIITNLITHLKISSSFGSVSATFRDHHLTDPVLTGLLLLLLPESAEVSLCPDLLKAQFRSFTNKFILHILGHDLNTRGLTWGNCARSIRARDSVEKTDQIISCQHFPVTTVQLCWAGDWSGDIPYTEKNRIMKAPPPPHSYCGHLNSFC